MTTYTRKGLRDALEAALEAERQAEDAWRESFMRGNRQGYWEVPAVKSAHAAVVAARAALRESNEPRLYVFIDEFVNEGETCTTSIEEACTEARKWIERRERQKEGPSRVIVAVSCEDTDERVEIVVSLDLDGSDAEVVDGCDGLGNHR